MKCPLIFLCLFLLTVAFVQAEYEIRVEDNQCELVKVVEGKAQVIRSIGPLLRINQGVEVIGVVSADTGRDFVLYRNGPYVVWDSIANHKAEWEKPKVVTKGSMNFTKFTIEAHGDDAYISAFQGETLIFKVSCLHWSIAFEYGRNAESRPGIPAPEWLTKPDK